MVRARTLRPSRRISILVIGWALTSSGCEADGTSPTQFPTDEFGTVEVLIRTGGVEVNPDGYTLLVGSTPGILVELNDAVTLSVPAGGITLELRDVPVTCDPTAGARTHDGTVVLTSVVRSGQRSVVTFDIVCTIKDIVFARVSSGNRHELYRMNADGSGVVQITSDAGPVIWSPRWSPDGTKIAYSSDANASANAEIFVVTSDGEETTMLCCGVDTEDSGSMWDLNPTWSPDGRMIAWAAAGHDTLRRGIHRVNVDGTAPVQLTMGQDDNPDWGPDGRILFTRYLQDPPNGGALYTVGAAGEDVTLLVEGVEAGGAWSPDGLTVAFTRVDPNNGTQTIWTVPSVGGQATQRVGEIFETQPRWSPDGEDLVFHYATDRNLVSATRGICVGPVEGATCERLTSAAGGVAIDVYPDWRRSSGNASARAPDGAEEPLPGALTAGSGGR